MTARSAILILNHFKDRGLVDQYTQIQTDCSADYDVVLLSDRTQPSLALARLPGDVREFCFTIDDLIGLGYPGKQSLAVRRRGERNMKLGQAELPVLLFFSKYPQYRYLWVVEYDVRYSGLWHEFFGRFEASAADLLGTTLMRFEECPRWSHWRSLRVPPHQGDPAARLRGFFPLYRLSAQALSSLHRAYLAGCSGHMEALVPTVLWNLGLQIEDVGGEGEFVKPENVNRFYYNNRSDNTLSPGTFVYRPAFSEVGNEPGKLWHPVKAPQGPGWIVRRVYARLFGALRALRRRGAFGRCL